LPESIIDKNELSGLLNWALDGLDRVLTNERFTNERSVDAKSELWEIESNPIANFLESWCIQDSDAVIPKDVLYQAYDKFCRKNEYVKEQLGGFTKKLKKTSKSEIKTGKRGPRGERVKVYVGVKLKDEFLNDLVSDVSDHTAICQFVENDLLDLDDNVIEGFGDHPDTSDTNSDITEYDGGEKDE